MIVAPEPVARTAHPLPNAAALLGPSTLRLEPRPVAPPLWRFALTGMGPLGVMGLIAATTAIGQWLGQ